MDQETIDTLIVLLFHLFLVAEELWEMTGHTTSVFKEAWPTMMSKMKEDSIEIAVQEWKIKALSK